MPLSFVVTGCCLIGAHVGLAFVFAQVLHASVLESIASYSGFRSNRGTGTSRSIHVVIWIVLVARSLHTSVLSFFKHHKLTFVFADRKVDAFMVEFDFVGRWSRFSQFPAFQNLVSQCYSLCLCKQLKVVSVFYRLFFPVQALDVLVWSWEVFGSQGIFGHDGFFGVRALDDSHVRPVSFGDAFVPLSCPNASSFPCGHFMGRDHGDSA